jgi:(p)ppGpp synthase/HD superfamily hydrolase
VAARAHDGQWRMSGDPYITHPITVATIVAEIGMSSETVCAALLHVEDTDYSLARLREDFGEVVARLVQDVTRLDKIKSSSGGQAQALTDRVLAIASDPRVLVLKTGGSTAQLAHHPLLAGRLRALVRAWRDPVSTDRSSRPLRDQSGPSEPEARRE